MLLHGDAAFAGQGIVWECLGFSGVRGYNTGGCIHFIVNNQVGFTTSPQFARSSPYPSDVAKGVQAPIFHVNGDDPEAVTFASKMAIEFRQRFKRDIVIDMWCYRRFGHNEGDEPGFTQPLMYKVIKGKPGVSEVYAARLAGRRCDRRQLGGRTCDALCRRCSNRNLRPGRITRPMKPTGSAAAGKAFPNPPIRKPRGAMCETGIAKKLMDGLGRTLTTVPEAICHPPDAGRVLEAKKGMFASGENFDWATGEALAFGSLVVRRLWRAPVGSGFGARHVQPSPCGLGRPDHSEAKYVPLSALPHGRLKCMTARSPNSACWVMNMALRARTPRRW